MTTAANFSAREIIKLILPKEHGSWSLALEPIALGLLVAPSPAGGALAIAAIAGFFLRRPLKILFREENDERLKIAQASILFPGIVAIAGLLVLLNTGDFGKLWPLIPAALCGLAFAWFDSRNEGREGTAEICGAIAFAILPTAFATLAGWNFIAAISLAAIMLTRSVPTVLFVRTYLRIKKGRAVTTIPAIGAAAIGFFLVLWLAISKMVPWIAVIFAFAMMAAAIVLLPTRSNISAKTIGIAEAIFGGVMMLTVATAWKFF